MTTVQNTYFTRYSSNVNNQIHRPQVKLPSQRSNSISNHPGCSALTNDERIESVGQKFIPHDELSSPKMFQANETRYSQQIADIDQQMHLIYNMMQLFTDKLNVLFQIFPFSQIHNSYQTDPIETKNIINMQISMLQSSQKTVQYLYEQKNETIKKLIALQEDFNGSKVNNSHTSINGSNDNSPIINDNGVKTRLQHHNQQQDLFAKKTINVKEKNDLPLNDKIDVCKVYIETPAAKRSLDKADLVVQNINNKKRKIYLPRFVDGQPIKKQENFSNIGQNQNRHLFRESCINIQNATGLKMTDPININFDYLNTSATFFSDQDLKSIIDDFV